MMDVILDLGYVLTYLVMVVLGMSELSLEASVGRQLWRSRGTEVQQQYLTKFLELLKFQCFNVSLVCYDIFYSNNVLAISLKDSHGETHHFTIDAQVSAPYLHFHRTCFSTWPCT